MARPANASIPTLVSNADDNMVSLTDPDGNTTTFQFDALNRQTKLTDPLGASATFVYDAADRLTSQTDRDGRVKLYTYDGLDRELTETWKSGTTTVNVLTFAYDPGDNITAAADYHGSYTMGYDTLARLTAEQEPFNLALTFGYDANDNRTLVQDSFGGVLTSVYDGLDRLTSRQFGGTGQTPLRFDLGYNSRNDIATVTRYSDLAGTVTVGYSSYSYDAVDRVTNIQHQNGSGSVLANYAYGYDLGSRLTHETADGSTRTFQYDSNNELTSDGLNSYSYDLNGNRTMTGYTTGTGNELTGDGTWTYAYDGEGNTISKRNTSTGELWTFGYDLDNRMVTAKDVSGAGATLTLATYTYDVFGNRLEKDVWTQSSGTTTVTRFGYDGDQVWADLASDNSLQMRYLRGDEADQLFARISGAGVVAWYLTDWEGSVRKLTDGSGSLQDTITYDSFGNVTAETNATVGGAYKFDGMRYDAETGDYSTWGRTDAPGVGRWLQQDPIKFRAADTNLYRYVGNNATDDVDPDGLQGQKGISFVSGTEVPLTASVFGFGKGTGKVRVFKDVTIRNRAGKESDGWIWLQFSADVDVPADTHWLQFMTNTQYDANGKEVRTPRVAHIEGKKVAVEMGLPRIDCLKLPSAKVLPYVDTTSKSYTRLPRLLAIVDRPNAPHFTDVNKQVRSAETYLVSEGKIYYRVTWKRVATLQNGKWVDEYTDIKGEPVSHLPKWAQKDTLFGGFFLDENGEPDGGNPVNYTNPVPAQNR